MTGKSDWEGRVGETWAQEWRRTDRAFGPLTDRLLAATRGADFARVLDIGCGAGELSLALARVRPDVRVLGVDVSPDLVEAARHRGSALANAEFAVADAATWTAAPEARPDLLLSRHGVMFFDDPTKAFTHLAAQAAGNADLLFSCFRAARENPAFSEIRRLLPDPPETVDPFAPGPFAFAERSHVVGILERSGWHDIAFEAFDFPMVLGTGDDPVEDALGYFRRIGPAAAAARDMDVGARERFFDRVRALCERHRHDGIVAMAAAAWIVTGRKA